jgi:hypothetical protein
LREGSGPFNIDRAASGNTKMTDKVDIKFNDCSQNVEKDILAIAVGLICTSALFGVFFILYA